MAKFVVCCSGDWYLGINYALLSRGLLLNAQDFCSGLYCISSSDDFFNLFSFFCVKLVMHSFFGLANQRSNSNITNLLSGQTFTVSINLMISFLLFSVLPW